MPAIRLLRKHAPFFAILGAGGLLRLWGLDWLPSAAGDEGNWALYALQILKREQPSLQPDAAFVTLLYAHVMAGCMKLLGVSFLAARLPNAAAGLVASAAAYAVLNALGSRRAATVVAAAVALHPWSVLYSRICSVPYSLALAGMTLGPLLFAAGVLRRRPFAVASGVMVTAAGAHFSPLAAAAVPACALFCLPRPRRWVFRSWLVWAAVAASLAHVTPVVAAALAVARGTNVAVFPDLPWQLWSYVHMVGTGLMGEATLRHFTSHAIPAWPASLLILPSAAVVVAAARQRGEQGLLAGFPVLYLVTALVVTPLVLGAGRDWHMPANHSDRYLFPILAGFLLCLGELAHSERRARRAAALLVVAWLGAGTARAAGAFLLGSGRDRGELIFDGGGGYRGWLVSDRPRNTLFQVRDHLLEEVRPHGGVLLVADRVFIPMRFVMEGSGIPVLDVGDREIPALQVDRYFFLLWPDSVLSVGDPPTAPPHYVAGNARLRRRLEVLFRRRSLVRRFVQRDGAPLLELWAGEGPRGRLAARFAELDQGRR